jgi:hypothetical protein
VSVSVCFADLCRLSSLACAYSNGREPDSVDDGVKSVERLQEEKRRAELSARIASGEFTVEKSGYTLYNNLGMYDDPFVSLSMVIAGSIVFAY